MTVSVKPPSVEVTALPAFPAERVVDPTGAGDSFAGGFMAALAAEGVDRDAGDAPFRQAMLQATVTASFVPEDFSVGGLLKRNPESVEQRFRDLEEMMVP